MKDLTVYTVGHSTRTLEQFVELVRGFGVDTVVDIRTVPRSRTNPQYNLDALPESLAAFGIRHYRIGELGGLHKKSKSIPAETNAFWNNRSFHNYADYALSDEFETGLNQLLAIAETRSCAIMCAEAVWWRCHRRIVADYLLVRNVKVIHILDTAKANEATLNPAASIRGLKVHYPATG